ncbi:MAG: alpha/beta fold hydrolase [Gemmatimonadaceae bacterium]
MTEVDEFELWSDRGDDSPLIIRGDARIPADPTGTVVICHGFKGFARWAFFPYLAKRISEAGLRAITFDFSGSGIGSDRENFTNPEAFTNNTFTQELDDLGAVIAEARVRDWIDRDFGLFGHSRGGGVAILHASRNRDVKALVTWAAISDTNRWPPEVIAEWKTRGYVDVPNARTGQIIPLGTAVLEEVERLGETALNIASAASSIRAPWLVIHGASDETVPLAEAERLHDWAKDTSELRIIDGANHAFDARHPLTEPSPTLDAVTRDTVNFFVRHVAADSM